MTQPSEQNRLVARLTRRVRELERHAEQVTSDFERVVRERNAAQDERDELRWHVRRLRTALLHVAAN